MCGILGKLNYGHEVQVSERSEFENALSQLKHRGPDAAGMYTDQKNILLGHRRLSIIDLDERANQPLHSLSDNYTIVFNGEIYNYQELRVELQKAGVSLKTESDTEVILELYEREGSAAFSRLRGMFALAIWDKKNQTLILARDHVGKKPLYYAIQEGGLTFGSELNALSRLLPQLSINQSAIGMYLLLGALPGENTIYSEVVELPPSHVATFDPQNGLQTFPYHLEETEYSGTFQDDEIISRGNDLLLEAVTLRLRADVPVGCFLSGGIDSGLVTALATRIAQNRQAQPIKTFCVGFSESDFDERHLARLVAEKFHTEHFETVLTPEIQNDLEQIVGHYGEPLADASIIPSFYVSQFAAEHCKVVLNGDGGDELFCGYRRHTAALILDRVFRYIPQFLCSALAAGALQLPMNASKERGMLGFTLRFLRILAAKDPDQLLMLYADSHSIESAQALYKNANDFEKYQGTTLFNRFIDSFPTDSRLQQLLSIDYHMGLPDGLLVKMDMATMAHGLEARSPFLDQKLASWANALPTKKKTKSNQTKWILRRLAAQYLPEEIIHQPKRGFEIPLSKWLSEELKEMSHDYILSKSGIIDQLFDYRARESLLSQKEMNRIGKDRWAKRVWPLLILAIWDKQCFLK